jgi:hypothetical protein
MLEGLKPDSSVATFFKAPDMPKAMRTSMKKSKMEAWKTDNSMWSIQEDLLRVAMPLMKAIEVNTNEEVQPLLSASGSLLGSAIQRLSVWRHRHSWLRDGYLTEVKPSMECVFGDEWTQTVEEEDKLNKVTQKVVMDGGKTYANPQGSKFSKSKPCSNKGSHSKYQKKRHGHGHRHTQARYAEQDQNPRFAVAIPTSDNFRGVTAKKPYYKQQSFSKN